MNKKLILTFLLVTISFALLLTPFSFTSNGAYNSLTKTIWCKTRASCVHEVGHYLDQHYDYPSKEWRFSLAVRMYITDETRKSVSSPLAEYIIAFQFQHHPGPNLLMSWPMGELYASIFAFTDGQRENMPAQLQEFYDWELAEKLLEKYKEKTW